MAKSLSLLVLFLAVPSLSGICPTQDSVCFASPAANAPANCGATGALQRPNILLKACEASIDSCVNLCGANSLCKSFAYLEGDAAPCQLYKASLRQQGFTQKPSAKKQFFSRSCYTYPPCPPLTEAFYLRASGAKNVAGEFLFSSPPDDPAGQALFTADAASASVFRLDSQQLTTIVQNTTTIANVDRDSGNESFVYFNTQEDITNSSGSFIAVSCRLTAKRQLFCARPGTAGFCTARTGNDQGLRLNNKTCKEVVLNAERAGTASSRK